MLCAGGMNSCGGYAHPRRVPCRSISRRYLRRLLVVLSSVISAAPVLAAPKGGGGGCRVSHATRHAEDPIDPHVYYRHWICSICASADDCCRAIRASAGARVPASSCEERAVAFSESDYSYLDDRDSTWYPRKDDAPATFFASEGFAEWLPSSTPDASAEATLSNGTESPPPPTPSFATVLSEEGGMHRRLRHMLSLSAADAAAGTPTTASVLVFLTSEWFVDQEEWLGSMECRREEAAGEGAVDGSRRRTPVECAARLHEATTTAAAAGDRIDIEQPSFASPHHVLRVDLEWNSFGRDEDEDDENDAAWSFVAELTTLVHMRYPQASSGLGYYHSFLPSPLLWLNGRPLPASRHPILKAAIPAGCSGDYTLVKWATILCMLLGSFIMLRSLENVSYWC